jgi:hypothetical protein
MLQVIVLNGGSSSGKSSIAQVRPANSRQSAARLIGTGQPTMRTATVVTTAAATVAKAGWASATPVRRTSP